MSLKLTLHSLSIATVAMLAGCASNVPLNQPAPVETRSGTAPSGAGSQAVAPAQPTQPSQSAGTAQSSVSTVSLTQGATAASAQQVARVVYFDFDSFLIRDEFKPVLEGHAKGLVANKGKRMVIEGHTDERGSREYNLALGQKRAEAVVKSLALLGAGANQVEPVSYGEERPATPGADEGAWAKNRRAELKDR